MFRNILLYLWLGCAAVLPCRGADAPVKVIFDTDMDTDCDDVMALAVLHALADRGEAEILATMVSSKSDGNIGCVDAINTYFGRPDLPIGCPKGEAAKHNSKYAKKLAEQFAHDLDAPEKTADAAELYRSILQKQPDQSVVLITVGELTNIAALLKLPTTETSVDGVTLVKQKVREWACMGGNFIGKPAKDDLKLGNKNFLSDKTGSYYAVRHWPTKLTFVGREIGSVPSGLKAGARLSELPEKNPVRVGYELYFGGQAKDRHLADPTTVLYGVRGLREYWDIESKGYMDLREDITIEWRYDQDKHAYLLKKSVDGKPNDRAIEKVIEELAMQLPKTRP